MTAANTRLQTPYGCFELKRYPGRRAEPMQAWCAADTLLLEEAHSLGIQSATLLVVNDEHGALCTALQPAALWTDSALSARALQLNQTANSRQTTPVIWGTALPSIAAQSVVMRIPRQLQYFEYQLSRLAASLPPGATVLAAGMDKHLSPRCAQLLEHYIGPTIRRRGQRKGRVFYATRDQRPATVEPAGAAYFCAALAAELTAMPNVFSMEKLDIGSRFLLEHLAALTPADTLIDLACGNGVLGLGAVKYGLANKVVFADESALAIASAKRNAAALFPQKKHHFTFHHGDGLLDYEGGPAGLILCNPPFHLNHAVDEFAGRHLLGQCRQHISSGGQLCIVANRHLDYRPTLKRDFTQVEKFAQNSKFIIWRAKAA